MKDWKDGRCKGWGEGKGVCVKDWGYKLCKGEDCAWSLCQFW